MGLREVIKKTIREHLNGQQMINEGWYHGSPDSREIEKEGGFVHKTMRAGYVTDPVGLKKLQQRMNLAKKSGNEALYMELLNKVSGFKGHYTYNRPLFLTDKYSVAKTYAVPQRAFDYQNAVEKVYEVEVNCNKVAKIVADVDRFRFISIDKVKQGFIKSGVSEEEIDKLISMFNYHISGDKGIETDVIAAIGNWLGFDCIDVAGVLDSYHGGTVKSVVRMVLDPTKARIKKA